MKILVVSDQESRSYWDYYQSGMLDDIGLILSAGDLDSSYLSFLVTMAHCPLLYVHGNHDTSYDRNPPEGCFCIDDRIYVHEGIRILGLGGSMRYNNGKYQYTEKEMSRRLFHLTFPLMYHKSIDILLTHSPIRGFHDGEDMAHRGFLVFDRLIRRFHPRYLIHGHVHDNYGRNFRRVDTYEGVTVINACGNYIFEYDPVVPKNSEV